MAQLFFVVFCNLQLELKVFKFGKVLSFRTGK